MFLLLLESAMIGVFVSIDLFLFYVFWDAMLVPMYFLIGIWGYDRRVYARVKFILFTMAGSVLMLLAILGLAYLHSTTAGGYSFDLQRLYQLDVPPQLQFWFFLAFALAFAIKVPLLPFHTWLPDAHVEAPTAGSVILAGVLLKMGTYGLVRFAFPLFPRPRVLRAATGGARRRRHHLRRARRDGAARHEEAGRVLERQPPRVRRARHRGDEHAGRQGAVYQMLNHGVSTGGLFLIVGMLSDRRHTR
jgi:NADH-quinone oxidoreductase subunit M